MIFSQEFMRNALLAGTFVALACGVRIFETATLNSVIISGVTWPVGMPLPAAMAFCKLPRWSIAAAAMTPFLFDSAVI